MDIDVQSTYTMYLLKRLQLFRLRLLRLRLLTEPDRLTTCICDFTEHELYITTCQMLGVRLALAARLHTISAKLNARGASLLTTC